MKPAAFDYLRPNTVAQALTELRGYGDEATILAGGQSLVPMMAFRLARPSVVLDINHLTELAGTSVGEDGSLVVGALTRQASLLQSTLTADWDVIREAITHIGHYPIRLRGTVGGSLAHADPAAELPMVALLLDAKMVLRSVDGSRQVAASDFFQGTFSTCRDSDELLTEIRFPPLPVGTTAAFEEFSRRRGDFALVAVAVTVTRDEVGRRIRARIALAGVAPTPVRALTAEATYLATPGPEGIQAAGTEAAAEIDPSDDVHGTAHLRSHLASELVRRALTRAEEQAA